MAWFTTSSGEPITASIVAVTDDPIEWSATSGGLSDEAWQRTAWQLWRRLGELHYPTSQVARLVSRLDWDTSPEFDLEEVSGPESPAETARLLALNLLVAGEVWYIKTERDDEGRMLRDGERWEVVATTAPKWNQRVKHADIKLHVWTADPVLTHLSDSPVRSVLGPARELVTLESLSRSQSRSRLSQGILLRPEADDNFSDDFREGMIRPIQDEDSVAAVVPIDVTTNDVTAWAFLPLERPYDEHLPEKMDRSIRRIALGLDIHPELLLGVADMNHWSSWLVQEDTWRSHTAPVASQVGDVFAAAAEQELGGDSYEVTPDPSEILARRSTVRDALDAAEIGAVGMSYVRDVIGADDADAPTDEELERLFPSLRRDARVDEAPGPPDEEGTPIAAAANGQPEDTVAYLASIDDVLAGQLQGLLEAETLRIRNRIGARVRSMMTGADRKQIDGVENADVVAELGVWAATDNEDLPEIIASSVDETVGLWRQALTRTLRNVEGRLDVRLDTVERRDAIDTSAEHLRNEFATWLAETLERPSSELPLPPDGRETIRLAGSGV